MKNELPFNNSEHFKQFLSTIIKQHAATDGYNWLQERVTLISAGNDAIQLQICFAAVARKIEKKLIHLDSYQKEQLTNFLPEIFIEGWTLHRLCRLYILLNLNEAEKEKYCHAIESLFVNAEMNERADLHAALPAFAYAQHWVKFCEEGIRSNIGVVLEAIMYNNPYPANYLEEAAWNQLVLKAFFTEKNINLIVGIDERANAPLAETLIDYAQERWAANRTVNVQLWRLVAPFIDDANFTIIEKLHISEDENTRLAAALACSISNYLPAKALLDTMPEIKAKIIANEINWGNISV